MEDEKSKRPKILVVWRCKNPYCPKWFEWTEPLAVEYYDKEKNVAKCPRCGQFTLKKIDEDWNDE